MSKKWWRWVVVYAVVTVLAFVFIDWILALFIAIMGLTLVIVGALASTSDSSSTFEERELARARKRAAKRERTAGARAKDRAIWEQHHRP